MKKLKIRWNICLSFKYIFILILCFSLRAYVDMIKFQNVNLT